jgi:hypothetical protein
VTTSKQWPKDWTRTVQRRVRHSAYDAYLQVGEEFGVPDYAVRNICGPVGQQNNIEFGERLAVLRAKMDAAGLVPTRNRPSIHYKDEEPDVPRELRSCVLCNAFLDDDDPGQDVIHSEDCDISAVVCRRCREAQERI